VFELHQILFFAIVDEILYAYLVAANSDALFEFNIGHLNCGCQIVFLHKVLCVFS